MKSVIICDMEGVIETINSDGEKLFGYSKEELVGKKRVSLFSAGEIVIQNVGMWLSQANKKGQYSTKTFFINKNGKKFNAQIKITPTFANGKNNPQTGYCGITVPIKEEVEIPIKFSTIFIKWAFAITRGGFTSASLFPIFAVAAFLAGSGDNLFSPLSLLLCSVGIVFLHVSSNLFNDYYDVKDGTDGANTEYFNAGLNSTVLEGAQLSGGSRAVELGLITHTGTLSLARKMLIAAMLVTLGLMVNSFYVTGEFSNALNALFVGISGGLLGYFYTARPLRLVARRGLGELAIFLSFGPLMTLGALLAISSSTIEVFSDQFYLALLLGIPHGLLTTNILYINQYPDSSSDAITGKNHLVVTFGKKNARWGYLIILCAAFLSSILLIPILELYLVSFNKNIFLVGNILLFAYGLYAFSNLYKNYNKRELIKSNLMTIYLQIFYGLFTIFILNLFFI
ncbi:MAG: UbiA family prenyltransferase [Flavobacteriaceae bacterium]|tara:strand:- start:119 stop:1483 length:1365 start_codon:yes stop_codon:yes gene_type:complete